MNDFIKKKKKEKKDFKNIEFLRANLPTRVVTNKQLKKIIQEQNEYK